MGSHASQPFHANTLEAGRADGLGDQGFSPVPRLVQWLVTARCPLSCAHCLAAGPTGPELTTDQALAVIDQVADLAVPELLLTGGEPLARHDFPALVDRLAQREQAWTLNTAVMPDADARAAIERHPPGFVAVSVDGPEEIHDAFRGRPGALADALEAVSYFGRLVPDGVCAGTTVTAFNIDHLPATFGLVLGSGATSWGLHLLVPEGRAAARPDLDLSVDQQRWLLRFTAEKRQHFAVNLADEIGFCGPFEPLVRDQPFFCGAGRAGCVVLPDGEVVPCTTLDRSTSAGNVSIRPLAEIWRTGFAELRQRTLTGKCQSCQAADLCGGGCWLRRRKDRACAKPTWRLPRVAAVAGLAALLGAAPAATAEPPGQALAARSAAEQRRLADLLRTLALTARQWRAEIFAQKLDPFLRRPMDYRRFMISKAGPTTLQRLESQVARSRGYVDRRHRPRDLAADFLKVTEHGQAVALTFDPGTHRAGLKILRDAGEPVDGCELLPFDLLEVDARAAGPIVLGFEVQGRAVAVSLPPGARLWYGDLLRLADDQNRDLLAGLARVDRRVPKRHPLLLPALLRMERELAKDPKAARDAHLRRVRWALVDLLLF